MGVRRFVSDVAYYMRPKEMIINQVPYDPERAARQHAAFDAILDQYDFSIIKDDNDRVLARLQCCLTGQSPEEFLRKQKKEKFNGFLFTLFLIGAPILAILYFLF